MSIYIYHFMIFFVHFKMYFKHIKKYFCHMGGKSMGQAVIHTHTQ